jgi:negative regulator of sigma E activity
MRQETQELSELLDGEISGSSSKRPMVNDEELKQLRRYQLIGEVMRQQNQAPLLHPQWGQNLSQRLQQEPSILAPVKPARSPARWQRTAAGLGIAASVTMVSLYLAPYWLHGSTAESNEPLLMAASPAQPTIPVRTVALKSSKGLSPEREQYFSRYLMEHGEVASSRGMSPMLPYASLVSYEHQGR